MEMRTDMDKNKQARAHTDRAKIQRAEHTVLVTQMNDDTGVYSTNAHTRIQKDTYKDQYTTS